MNIDFGVAGKGRHIETGNSAFGYMWFYLFPDIEIKNIKLQIGTIKGITVRWLVFYFAVSFIKVEMSA